MSRAIERRTLMIQKLMMGCAVAAMLFVAAPVSASPPANQACIGKSVSANAKVFQPNYGAFISSVTPRNDFGSLGDAVQAVKAGLVPDEVYPNTCND
jgi:hypothetical protein